ncbi:MAG TPA: hypothetical protein VFR28_08900 [Allosphingosinicella sp.]|nr:hypothetical protein [Allosphingosinicella sp.]
MIALSLLALAQPSAAAPAGLVQLDCEVAARGRARANDKWPASIRLALAGGRIESVLLDGPAPFSSYVPVEGSNKLLHKRDQYRGSFQKGAIRLRRTGMDRVDLVLEPKEEAGSYAGFWTHMVMIEQRPIETNGTIACRSVAGTLAGNS